MTHRLTAFVLALLIGCPTCWCCVPHEAASVKTAARHSCCHPDNEDAAPSGKSSQKKHCPCATSLIKRDLTDGKFLLPKIGVDGVAVFLPASFSEAFTVSMTVRNIATPVDEDPPWHRRPLYERHCALLL